MCTPACQGQQKEIGWAAGMEEWPARPTAHRKDCCPSLIAQLCQHGHSLQVGGLLVLNLPLPGPAVQHAFSILSECAHLYDVSPQQLMKVKHCSVKQQKSIHSSKYKGLVAWRS